MKIKTFNESYVEEAAIQWFQELGYTYLFGPDIGPNGDYSLRKSYFDVILEEELLEAMSLLNNDIPDIVLKDALNQLKNIEKFTLVEKNKYLHKMVTNGISVSFQDNEGVIKYRQVKIIDFDNLENNNYSVSSQFTVLEGQKEKRPDLVVFLNGIPISVFELKTISDENISIDSAFNQIKTYQEQIPSLFTYNMFNVISDGLHAKVGTLTSNLDRYMTWRTLDGDEVAPNTIPQLEVTIKGMFCKKRILDLIKNYILFQTKDNNTVKILAGYHQYHAVNTAMESTLRASNELGDNKIGVVWHTQGSGKSLTMVFYSAKLVSCKKLLNPTIIVLTDRNDLDDQLFDTFMASSDLLRNTPIQAENRDHLKLELSGRTSGGIIFTTIQKFNETDEGKALSNRSNIIVLVDEAHRSQYGFSAKIQTTNNFAAETYGYAKYMRDSLPNASYIGFTGTPIQLTDKNTRAVFGDYISIYDMTRSIEDGSTVKIFYESRIAKIDFTDEYLKIDENFEEITEYQEETQKNSSKSKWTKLEAIVGSDSRLNNIAEDIITHFENRQLSMVTDVGKAMIVTMSRRIAIVLYEKIISLRPEWHSEDINKGRIKIVMTGSSSDPLNWQKHIGNKQTRELLSRRMKDNYDELEIVIVCDMWLTGFDVPSLHTMYIDKPMQGHNLMQAIARVNRVFKQKQGGLIVDYIGIADNLKSALNQYTDNDKTNTAIDSQMAVDILKDKIELIRELLYPHNYSEYPSASNTIKLQIIMSTIDYVIGLREQRKNDYIQLSSDLSKAYSLCSTTPEAMAHNLEISFYKTVRAGIIKLNLGDSKKKSSNQLDHELNQLISKSLESNSIIDIMSEIGLENPDVSILSEEFLEDFKEMKNQNIAIELLKRLIQGKIKAFSKITVVRSRLFSEMLDESLRKYQNRLVESSLIIHELIQLAKEITLAEEEGKDTGLTVEEYAFYEALSSNLTAKEVMGTEVLKEIAKELTDKIKLSTSIDWNIRENIRAGIRFEIKLLLNKYQYPPDDIDAPNNYDKSVDLILQQTELMFSSK